MKIVFKKIDETTELRSNVVMNNMHAIRLPQSTIDPMRTMTIMFPVLQF